jgi:hypothetical protein
VAVPDDAADRIIRWSTAGAVVGVAAVAAVASHEHAYDLVLPTERMDDSPPSSSDGAWADLRELIGAAVTPALNIPSALRPEGRIHGFRIWRAGFPAIAGRRVSQIR